MMKRLFFLVLFIVGGAISLEKCIAHKWGEDHYTQEHHEVVRNQKIELYPRLNVDDPKSSLDILTQAINRELTKDQALTISQVRKILVIQQIDTHERFVKFISIIDRNKHFNTRFFDALGNCIGHFQRFIFSFRNRNLLGQHDRADVGTRIQMATIHNDWGNTAKHKAWKDAANDHQHDDNDDENIKNALRFLSPANVRPIVLPEVKPEAKPTVAPPAVKPTVAPPAVKPTVAPPAVKPTVASPAVKPTVAPPAVKPTVVPPAVKNLSTEERIIQKFIDTKYNRDSVTKFIDACPWGTQQYLATNSDISPGTITKLKNPQTYGPLNPSARRFWAWLESNTVEDLKRKLYLSDQGIKEMAQRLNRR